MIREHIKQPTIHSLEQILSNTLLKLKSTFPLLYHYNNFQLLKRESTSQWTVLSYVPEEFKDRIGLMQILK
jgi:hypothetical protein